MAKQKKTGLGDVVKSITQAIGIEPCASCEERRKALNRMFPFQEQPTDEEVIYLKEVFNWYKGLPLTLEQAQEIRKCIDIWIRLERIKTEPCYSCGAQFQNNVMNRLKKIIENYN